VDANQQLELEKAVLQVFPEITAATNAEIHKIFTERFIDNTDTTGAYLYYRNHQLAGYAVPVEGKGFWASIKGIVGVEMDRATITGIAFYEQSETPGLGARIVEDDFCDQFVGKKIAVGEKPLGIIPSTEPIGDSQVHSITGATQTCVRLEKLVNDGLNTWLTASSKEAAQ
jgi:Na(+)-translocating NADH:ubiquinone oxidoreductase C subunit